MIASGDIISQAEAAKRSSGPPVQSPCARVLVRLRLGDLPQLLCPGRVSESYNKLSFKADSNGNCLTPGTVQSKIPPEICPPRLSVINMARSGFQDVPRDLFLHHQPITARSLALSPLFGNIIPRIHSLSFAPSNFDRSCSPGAVGRSSCSEALDKPPQIVPRRTVIMHPPSPVLPKGIIPHRRSTPGHNQPGLPAFSQWLPYLTTTRKALPVQVMMTWHPRNHSVIHMYELFDRPICIFSLPCQVVRATRPLASQLIR